MPKFIPYDYNQHTLIVINFLDQLQPGTFEHALYTLVENKLNLSAYFPGYKNEDTGRPAYDPAILLKIILFAYSKGITSSREMNWQCQTNIIFKALSCDTVPHHTTLASFVSGHTEAIESVFVPQGIFSCFAIHLKQILLTCDDNDLLGHELFVIDGCKMPSDASREWSGTFKELSQKRDKIKRLIEHHIEEDKKLPTNEPMQEARKKRAKQAVETLTKSYDKIEHFLKTAHLRLLLQSIKSIRLLRMHKPLVPVRNNIPCNRYSKRSSIDTSDWVLVMLFLKMVLWSRQTLDLPMKRI